MARERSAGLGASTTRSEIKALTGLRLVAALVVLLGHFKPVLAPYLDQVPVVRPVLDAGWLGVEVFFVLSGFVIARSYIEEVGGRFAIGKAGVFLYNRFARVWPVWAVVTTAMAVWIGLVRFTGHVSDVVAPHPPAELSSYLRQLSMTQMWGESNIIGPSYVLPGWSISAEWAAYLAFPLLAVALLPLRRLHPLVPLVMATLVMAPMALEAFRFGPLDPQVPWLLRLACSFVAGILVAIAMLGIRRTERVERIAYHVAVGSTALFLVVCFWAYWRRAGDPAHDYAGTAVVLFPALIGALSLTTRGPAAWLSRGPLVYGGRISYCLYLVHFVVYDVTLTYLWQNPADRLVTPALALAVPLMIVACFLLSMALHHGVEQPARRRLLSWRVSLADRLGRARSNGSAASPAVAIEVDADATLREHAEPAPRQAERASQLPATEAADAPDARKTTAALYPPRPREPETVSPGA